MAADGGGTRRCALWRARTTGGCTGSTGRRAARSCRASCTGAQRLRAGGRAGGQAARVGRTDDAIAVRRRAPQGGRFPPPARGRHHRAALREARLAPAQRQQRRHRLHLARPRLDVPQVLRGHKGGVSDVAVHPSGALALTTGRDATLRTWDLTKGRQAFSAPLEAPGERRLVADGACSRRGRERPDRGLLVGVGARARAVRGTWEDARVRHGLPRGRRAARGRP